MTYILQYKHSTYVDNDFYTQEFSEDLSRLKMRFEIEKKRWPKTTHRILEEESKKIILQQACQGCSLCK